MDINNSNQKIRAMMAIFQPKGLKKAALTCLGILTSLGCFATTSPSTTTVPTPVQLTSKTTNSPKAGSKKSTHSHYSSHKKTVAHKKSKHTHHHATATADSSTDNPLLANLNSPLQGINDNTTNSMDPAPPIDLNFQNNASENRLQRASHFFTRGFSASGHSLVTLAEKTVGSIRHTMYKLGGTHFDESHGFYEVDCSDYVDNLLHQANPQAYSTLAQSSGTYKPTTKDYYEFFNKLPNNNWNFWHKIDGVKELQAGDILVFRYKNSHSRNIGGHVMVVMNKPVPDKNSPDVFWVNVSDSASSGHSNDTRPAHTSGIGIGAMLLKVNPATQQPDAYAWKAGSSWMHNISFVMATPMNTNPVS